MVVRPRIVCCSPFFGESWRWLEHRFDGRFEWTFFNDRPRNLIERKVQRPNVRMLRSCLECAVHIARHGADLLVTHDPRVTFWCSVFLERMRARVDHIAYSFNYPNLPRGLKHAAMSRAFRRVSRFVVFSTMERSLYATHFGIREDLIDVVLWAVGQPKADPDQPIETGDYVCALGGNARDYPTLMAAAEKTPEIPLVVVVRPHNLDALFVPPHVRVHVNIPLGRAMNILAHSRFMVLPLLGTEVPCGHVTLVAAMHLGKAMIITNSNGIADYITDGWNGVACDPFSADALATTMRSLWSDPERCATLGEHGRAFAAEHNSEDRAYAYVRDLLTEKRLL